MIALLIKSKQYGWYALKVGILMLSFHYIYQKLYSEPLLFRQITATFLQLDSIPFLFFMCVLSATNWLLESKKWQLLVGSIEDLSLQNAIAQTLSSLALSLWTPNRIGEYGARPMYYPMRQRKKIMGLTAINHMAQMLSTCVFGCIGLLLTASKLFPRVTTSEWVLGSMSLVVSGLLLAVIYRKAAIKKIPLVYKVNTFIQRESRNKLHAVIGLSILRFLVFSTQFYLILVFFEGPLPWLAIIPAIYLMYLLVSLVPIFPFLDIVVKGSVALWLLSQFGISETPVLTTVFAMWLLNLVIPTIFGSLHIIKAPNR